MRLRGNAHKAASGRSALTTGRAVVAGGVLLALVVTSCAPSSGIPLGGSRAESHSLPLKRIVAAIQGNPHTLYQKMNPSSHIPGIENLELLVNGPLAQWDQDGVLQQQLAEEVPTVENGHWKVFPDGRMETTWKIKPNVFWHDGTPFSTSDLLFTLRLSQDRDLDILLDPAYQMIEAADAVDASSITVRWSGPYLEANTLFTPNRAMPLPRHLLETAYTTDKARLFELPFWTEDWIGTGPFKLRQFVQSSHMVLEANDHYVLGRPRLDEIEVKFIPDQNTLIANVLAGVVELTLSRGLSVEQASVVLEQWKDGKIAARLTNWVGIWPQFVNPSPAIVTDARFRRALLHAMDRQEMVDVIQNGFVPVAHSHFNPADGVYKDIESAIVRYEYEPRKSVQIIEGLGFVKAPDGLYQDGTGKKLEVELRTSATRDASNKAVLATADYWQKAGVGVDISITPPALARDEEYRDTYPAFELKQTTNDLAALKRYGPDPAGKLKRGNNSYSNPQLDELTTRVFVTLSARERAPLLREITRHMTEEVAILGVFYGADPFLIGGRVLNVSGGSQEGRMAWNASSWDVK